jgi:hypothetical protein
MRNFKYLILLPAVFVALVAESCRKSGNVTPSKPIDTDAVIHSVTLAIPTQFVAISTNGPKLTMIYYENVDLDIPSKGVDLSYALHLTEDFGPSILASFDYFTIDQAGHINVNWVDGNLNNVSAKTKKDTVINSVPVTRITVQRPFTFSKIYATAAEATDEQTQLLARKGDKINFSSYVYFTKTYPATALTTSVLYVKAN